MKELVTLLLLVGVILCVNTGYGRKLWQKSLSSNNLVLRNVNAAVNHLQDVVVAKMNRGVVGGGHYTATNVYVKVEPK